MRRSAVLAALLLIVAGIAFLLLQSERGLLAPAASRAS